MATQHELLRWGIIQRVRAFQRQIENERAEVGSSGAGLAHALELFLAYTRTLLLHVETIYASSEPALIKLRTLSTLRNHLTARAELFDERFARGHRGLDPTIASLIDRECHRLGITDTEVLITVGPPENFASFVRDLRLFLFKDLHLSSNLPDHLAGINLLSIAVPRTEGLAASWIPITVGHELAHYLQHRKPLIKDIDILSHLDQQKLESYKDVPVEVDQFTTQARLFEAIAYRWVGELICDAYSVHRFGAAGVSALAEFLQTVTGFRRESGITHPPTQVRVELMRRWLRSGRSLTPVEHELLGPYNSPYREADDSTWIGYLSQVALTLGDEIAIKVAEWSEVPSYASLRRDHHVTEICEDLDNGIPALAEDISLLAERDSDRANAADALTFAADVINACWLAGMRFIDKPVERLTLKSIDTIDFLSKWSDAGGPIPRLAPSASPTTADESQSSAPLGTLSADELHRRLAVSNGSGIRIIPLLSGKTKGASIDLRLGNSFLVFEQSTTAAFDALDPTQYPRSMQRVVSKAWGDVFHLHPRQLVLAATLEYIVLPGDICAHVVTRSSYGRLGLISATAIQVHPNYSGCLTLELVNLGEMPLTITPGERVAQLVFTTTTELIQPDRDEKYRYPTKPEFSKITLDGESAVLRTIRRNHATMQPLPPGMEQFEVEVP